ncbi:hypothetical protein EXS70_01625 [Candidatus Peribacteria bacterium]|nr:hypothetical protein [Candidatus Peribacteria bacterium]
MQPIRRLLTLWLLVSCLGLPHARAQESAEPPVGHVTMHILAGDVLEFIGVRGEPAAEFDWVLTQNGAFVEAGRENIYRTRLTQDGHYTLIGQMAGTDTSRRLEVNIEVLARTGAEETRSTDDFGLEIVTTGVPLGERGVQVSSDKPLLTLTPSPVLNGPIAIDLDTGNDTDRDGDAGNDNDVADTLFSTEHNPLHVWYAVTEDAASMHLTTTASDGTPLAQDIDVVGGSLPVPEGTIGQTDEREGVVRFSFGAGGVLDPAAIVYRWDFGDSTQSMLDAPVHTYRSNGPYTIHVSVREMTTGRVIAEGATELTIRGIPAVATNQSSSSSSVKSEPTQPGNSGSSGIWTILKILLLLVVTIGLGALIVTSVLRFLHREGSLQKALEQAEGKLIKKDKTDGSAVDTAPATMKLKRPEPPTAPIDVTPKDETMEQAIATVTADEKPPVPRPAAPPPLAPEAPAPAWLQQGLKVTKEQQPPDAPSTPEPAPMPPEPAPLPPMPEPMPLAPEPTSPLPEPTTPPPPLPEMVAEQPASNSEDDMLPPWLKDDSAKGTEATNVASAEPMPAPTPEPTPPPPVIDTPLPTPPPPPVPTPIVETPPPPAPPVTLPAASTVDAPVTASTQPSPSPLDAERAERERERKRRKRQRYRENLKKRNSDAGLRPAEMEAQTQPNPVTPTITAAPAPSAPVPIAPPPPPPAPAPIPTVTPPSPVPSPVPNQKPIVQDIPPANPAKAIAPEAIPDDNVAFVIKAEGIENPDTSKKGKI